MPPKYKFEKQEIVQAGLRLLRKSGMDAITARAVAAELNASPKVIFGYFESMEAFLHEILLAANALYQEHTKQAMQSGTYPMYKASGMAYIDFAEAEPQLFQLLFMRDRSEEAVVDNNTEMEPIWQIIQQNTGLSRQEAELFHAEMWIFVHGIATMLATGYFRWETGLISDMLSDSYEGLKTRFATKKGVHA